MRTQIKYVDRWKDRHGKERFYFRKGKGARIPLRGPEGSPEFWEDYHKAANGEKTTQPASKRAKTGTMRWLVEKYYKSAAFKELGDNTKIVRRRMLDKFCEKHGSKRYGQLEPRHLRKIRDGLVETPEAANGLLKVLRQVFKFAVDYDYTNFNPVVSVEYLKSKNKDGFHAWSPDEIKKFKTKHPVGTKARLAFALLLYTGQRRSDIIKMGRKLVRGGLFTFVQQKTGSRIEIPFFNELKRVISASPTGDLTFLVTAFNKPYTANGFGNWFRRQCNDAGLPHCSAHGLRKAAAARLAEMGCSAHQIMSITGHRTLKEVERYTKTADQKRLAALVRDRIDG